MSTDDAVATQQDIFNDYCALLHAVLPNAHGFIFYDRKQRLYRKDQTSVAFHPDKNYQNALQQTLNYGDHHDAGEAILVDSKTAFLFQIKGDSEVALGVVVVLVNEDLSRQPKVWIFNQIKPALDSLTRELSLRFKLVKTHRKYSEKSAD